MPVDSEGWWQSERARLVRSRIIALTRPGDVVVDVGCGRADMLDHPGLADRVRINVDSHRWNEWRGRHGMLFVVANADALPFRSGSADLVGSFDVLEHIPDDRQAVREQVGIARPDAHIVAAVPADPRLWSTHDEAVGHKRRYTYRSFESLARGAGLTIRRRTHFYSFLWLPAWLARHTSTRGREPAQGTGLVSRIATLTIRALAGTERIVLRRRSIPFGTSLWFEMSRHGDGARRTDADP